jgi:plasmid stability protein
MSTLHVRNVPDDLYRDIQQRAAAQGRSLSAEVVHLLAWAVAETDRSPVLTLAAIRSRRSYRPTAAGAPDSTALLREDRQR